MRVLHALLAGGLLGACAIAHAADYLVPEETRSPDGKLGVRVPIYREGENLAGDRRRNAVIEVGTGRVVTELAGSPPAYDVPLNHHDTGEATWSDDGGLLRWHVHGKWNPDALEVVRFDPDHRARWQVDVLRAGREAILARTRAAAPEAYAAAKRANAGAGSAFPDGFTVDVGVELPEDLPLDVRVDLTANPKAIEDFPGNLDAHLDAEITADGRFVVRRFALGPRPADEP